MPLDKKFYIHTGKDGVLEDTTDDDVRALVADLKNAPKLVVHLHGGLISEAAALEKAERLTPAYQAAGARPVSWYGSPTSSKPSPTTSMR